LIERGFSINEITNQPNINVQLKSDMKLDIEILKPMLLIPLDLKKVEDKQCLLLVLDRVEIKSIIPPKILQVGKDGSDQKSENLREVSREHHYHIHIDNKTKIEPVLEREKSEHKLKINYLLSFQNFIVFKIKNGSNKNLIHFKNTLGKKFTQENNFYSYESIPNKPSEEFDYVIKILSIDMHINQDFKQSEIQSNIKIIFSPIFINIKEKNLEFLYRLYINLGSLRTDREFKKDIQNCNDIKIEDEIKAKIDTSNKSWSYLNVNLVIAKIQIALIKNVNELAPCSENIYDLYDFPKDKPFIYTMIYHFQINASFSFSSTKETNAEVSLHIDDFFIFDTE